MDAVKRSRFATKQMRAGPAPLASFEDLPSDELESPEDYSHIKTYAIDDESTSRDLQFATPDSLTISSQSTPRIESDFDSHFTLTPGDSYQGQSTSELRTASLSSLSKDDSSTLNVRQKKGSATSLGTLEATDVEYTHRKSSWTDIFRSHNQTSAKTSSASSHLNLNEKSFQKKSKTDSKHSKKDSETKSKDKGKFLSIFKKKNNKQIVSPVSTDNYILPNETSNATECLNDLPEDITNISNGNISMGKENESPSDNEPSQAPCEIQNDLGKVNSDRCDKIPDERRLSRKVINIPEETIDNEFNILSQQVEEKKVDKVSKTDNIQVIADFKEDLESSESELTFETKDVIVEEKEEEKEEEEKEDDFEAEILLPDLSEIEEDSIIEHQPVTFEVSKQIMIPSKQQRLEITTKPIDRPRSTTPINVAPLEAFIQSFSPTFNAKMEKIKLSLPGEQFVGRVKSPKKSMKSWTDFCERGLHSPRMHRKFDKESQKSPFKSSDGASLSSDTQFSENWAAFESDFATVETNIFEDNFGADFGVYETAPCDSSKNLSKSYQYFESDFSFNPKSSGCASCCKFGNYKLTDAQFNDQSVSPTPCKGCSCQCHSKQKSNSPEHCSNIDAFGASKILSLVTDEQF